MVSDAVIRTDFRQASMLLRDKNLIWSADLDSIREDLANYLDERANYGADNSPHLIAVVRSFIADENDISI